MLPVTETHAQFNMCSDADIQLCWSKNGLTPLPTFPSVEKKELDTYCRYWQGWSGIRGDIIIIIII